MKLILAVSGGIDSMTMADILLSHSHLCELDCEEFAIAHCNFQLRPSDCDADEELVRTWAAERGIRFFHKSFDTRAYAQENACSIEVAARELRYRWFIQLCRENGYDGVACAHHSNDNAETLILNLIRGCGIKGLCGMTARDRLPYQEDGGSLLLLRPLIHLTREEIQAYALEHSVPWREDSTNAENEYRRNAVRNRLIPLLKELNPSLELTLAADMENFRAADEALSAWFSDCSKKYIRKEGEVESVSFADLKACLAPRQFLWEWLSPKGFTRDSIRNISGLLCAPSSGKIFPSGVWLLCSSTEGLILFRKEGEELSLEFEEGRAADWDYRKAVPGRLVLDALSLGSYDLRHWQEGDWFIPLGMKGRKKLSDWFTDIKAPLPDKARALVIQKRGSSDGRIAAVFTPRACRQDESTRVPGPDAKVLVAKLVL